MLKKYQVLETKCGEFGVFNIETVNELGEDARSLFKSEYASEAQEKADEMNGDSNEQSESNPD